MKPLSDHRDIWKLLQPPKVTCKYCVIVGQVGVGVTLGVRVGVNDIVGVIDTLGVRDIVGV